MFSENFDTLSCLNGLRYHAVDHSNNYYTAKFSKLRCSPLSFEHFSNRERRCEITAILVIVQMKYGD